MTTWSDRILLDLHHVSMIIVVVIIIIIIILLYLNPSIEEALRDAPLSKARRKV